MIDYKTGEVTVEESRPHQFFGGERLSLFSDDETITDTQSAEQLSPTCQIIVCLQVFGTQEYPVEAWLMSGKVDRHGNVIAEDRNNGIHIRCTYQSMDEIVMMPIEWNL